MTRHMIHALLVLVGATALTIAIAELRTARAATSEVATLAPVPDDSPLPDTWRTGTPLGVIALGAAAFAMVAARRDSRRGWLWSALAVGALLIVDMLRTGMTPTAEMLLTPGAVLAAGAMPGIGPPRNPERGSASGSVLVWLASAGLLLLGAGLAGSCSAVKQGARVAADGLIDCTTSAAKAHAAEMGDAIERAILDGTAPNGEVRFDGVEAIVKGAAIDVGGCALATTIGRLIYEPRPQGLIAAPDPAAASLRRGFDAVRGKLWGGARFKVEVAVHPL